MGTEKIIADVYNIHGDVIGGYVELDDGIVTSIGGDPSGGNALVPGFVDVHCHGGGGCSFPDDLAPEDITTGVRTHLSGGTTYLIASLVSMIDPLPAIEALVGACERGELIGIHLEGPYVSEAKCGAQNPAAIRQPDLDELRTWLEAGKGWIKHMTIAPEKDNALEVAKLLHEYGARPSWGHTSSTTEQARSIIDATTEAGRAAGMTGPVQTATHLFNAMPTLAHREPGPIRELMAAASRGEAVVEIIGDGVHVYPDLVGDVLAILDDHDTPGAMLITDAMAGANMPDGQYVLGSQAVTIADGVARLTEGHSIAGGTARLGDEFAVLTKVGVPLDRLIRATTLAPQRAFDLDIEFSPVVGKPLTAVLLDENRTVSTVWKDGTVIQ